MHLSNAPHWPDLLRVGVVLLLFGLGLRGVAQEPAPDRFEDSAGYRWLQKKVLASRVLDDMDTPAHWTAFTTGAPAVVDARAAQKATDRSAPVAEMTFSRERSRDGRQSLRMRLPVRLDGPGPTNGRGWGSAGVRRQFDHEDWREFNRLSLWIYPDCPGWNVLALELRLSNDGVEKLPALFGQEGETTVVLQNRQWNHVVWEVGNVARDRVTRLEISALLCGHEPEAADVLTYYLDRLELEQVEPDYIEGWDVWPGRISYSHVGYQSGAAKSAIATGLKATEFHLVDQATGNTVLSKAVQSVKTRLGEFQIMDFSELQQNGEYVLEAGEARTRPFRVDPNVWRETVLKALNFLHAERCGIAIPGIHGICHRDWTVVHGDQRIVINGGWHDAGDLTQGLGNTGEIVYGLFSLAERLRSRDEDPALYDRLVDEARWGLDWILKTSFGDGYRNQGAISSRWTDGVIGNSDDLTTTARNSPMGNFTAAAAEAIAARVLMTSDPRLAAYCLKMAESDWRFALAGLTSTNTAASAGPWRGTFDSENVEHETAAVGVLASLDLWQITGNQQYADKSVELAGVILASQERKRPNWEIPLMGFFYTGPGKDRVLHYCHRGREQAPILALTRLCDAFPDHPDWMKWYSAVALYAEYLKAVAKYTEPYGVMPASIYQAEEYLTVPESRRESFRRQVLQGIPLGEGHYLRLFPVWMDYRGHFGVILPQAQALLAAAHLRGDLEAVTLAQHQAEWIIGRNPFSQSAMYGAGYDFPPLYAPFPGDVVGALPVGLQTRGDRDVPYWPVQSTWTYKEVWVHPVARWIWLMRDLAGPALVEGQADSAVEFIPMGIRPGAVVRAIPTNGRFRAMVSEGNFTVRSGGFEQTWVFLPAGTYHLDLRSGHAMDYTLSKLRSGEDEIRIKVEVRGSGRHRFQIRTDNLTLSDGAKELDLTSGGAGALEWQARIGSFEAPWTAVLIADGNPSNRKELTGATWESSKPGTGTGQLIMAHFTSAPFPHAERAQGRTYQNQLFPAEKHYADNTVAIFVPEGFRETDHIDAVVHFHGWRNSVARALEHYRLTEQFQDSHRNAVLVVPQGPLDAPDSFGGKLEDPDGFRRFMDEVMSTLRANSVLAHRNPTLGKIILSAHSGGYQVVSSILDHGGLSGQVKEVWLFDALYAGTDKFLAWLEQSHGRLLNLYTDHGGTKEETERLMATLKQRGVPFFAGKESDVTLPELRQDKSIILRSELEHDSVIQGSLAFLRFLQTSGLEEL